MKIHIVGLAGSGKTTLGRWVSREFSMRVYDLDWIVYDAAGERPSAEILDRLGAIRAEAGCVTEGAYGEEWLLPLLDDADAIVWLDIPLRTCLARIIKRHIRAELARNNQHAGWRKLVRFLNYTRRTARVQETRTLELLSAYANKTVRCRSSRDVEAWRERMRPRRS